MLVREKQMDPELIHTCKKPIIAWKPPIKTKSIPYWNGAIDTRKHAAKHFQLARTPLFS
jgi:hypothetical protein